MTLLVDTTVRRPSEAELLACAVFLRNFSVLASTVNERWGGRVGLLAEAVDYWRTTGFMPFPMGPAAAPLFADLAAIIDREPAPSVVLSDALRATAAYLRSFEASGESRGEYGAAPGASTTRQQGGQSTPAPPTGTRAVRPAVVPTPAAANAGQATGGGTALPRVLRRWPLLAALLGLLTGGCKDEYRCTAVDRAEVIPCDAVASDAARELCVAGGGEFVYCALSAAVLHCPGNATVWTEAARVRTAPAPPAFDLVVAKAYELLDERQRCLEAFTRNEEMVVIDGVIVRRGSRR